MSDERMTTDERRKYLKQMQKRYQAASRGEKGKLLDEMVAVTGQHRKGLIRLMNGAWSAGRARDSGGSDMGRR